MKKLFLVLSISALSAFSLAGCVVTQAQQAQDIMKVFCADVQPFNALIATIPNVSSKVTTDIALAKPVVEVACANPSAFNPASVQSMMATGFPLILDIADALPATAEVKTIIADIQMAQAILPGVLVLLPQPAASATQEPSVADPVK